MHFPLAIKGGGKPTRLLPHAKMLLVPIVFFLCWVDYALEGSTFSLSKCDLSCMFDTERSWHTYRFTVVIVSGRQDLSSDARAFSFTSFEAQSFLLRLNKGFTFLQSAFWIWITKRFSLVRDFKVVTKNVLWTLFIEGGMVIYGIVVLGFFHVVFRYF